MTSRVFVRCQPQNGPPESIVVPLRDGATVDELLRDVRRRAINRDGLGALYIVDGAVRAGHLGHRLHSADLCGNVRQSVVSSGDTLVAAGCPSRRHNAHRRRRGHTSPEPRLAASSGVP